MANKSKKKEPNRMPKKSLGQVMATPAEMATFRVLNNQIAMAEQQRQEAGVAMGAFIELLEAKYNATYNPQTGILIANPVKKEEL